MEHRRLTLASPAKVNLFLRVLARRADGYHDLASLFQAIDLSDTLHITLDTKDSFTCNVAEVPTDGSNLVLKALSAFRRGTGLSFGVRIHLDKRIPMQAGLGGGSSNAATTLWALNELLMRPVGQKDLFRWASAIGSDVSFFLSQGTAYCTGRGEVVRPLKSLPHQSLWIVKPNEGLSTPEVYRRLDLKAVPQRDPQVVLRAFFAGNPTCFNDLEAAALSALPRLADLKQELERSGFSQVLLSGSGTSFFCLGDGDPPFIPGVELYPAGFVNRPANSWYPLKG